MIHHVHQCMAIILVLLFFCKTWFDNTKKKYIKENSNRYIQIISFVFEVKIDFFFIYTTLEIDYIYIVYHLLLNVLYSISIWVLIFGNIRYFIYFVCIYLYHHISVKRTHLLIILFMDKCFSKFKSRLLTVVQC